MIDVKTYTKDILKKYHFSHYTIEVELDTENCDLTDDDKKSGN